MLMKTLNRNICICSMAIVMVLGQACQKNNLEDFASEKNTNRTLSVKGISGTIKKDAENVRIPIEISLSAQATQAFEAYISLDAQTVVDAIAGNNLPNTAALPVETIVIPQAITVPYGATKVILEAVVSVSGLEKFYYGTKKAAFAVKLISAEKGNTIDAQKSTGIISVDPREIIGETEMHYVFIANGGGAQLDVSGLSNYTASVSSIGIPLGIALSGAPTRSFTVDIITNTDTIAVLKANGKLPANAVAMQDSEYEFPATVNIAQSSNTAQMEVIIPSSTLLKYKTQKIALVVQISTTSRHVIHPINRTVVLLIDPASIIAANNYTAMLRKPEITWLAALQNLKFNSTGKIC